MARTKQEVRNFLNGLVGKVCIDKSNHRLNGQCVCMIKNLMEFLGVPNPYTARGNAKDAGNNYIAQGIGTRGKGWLTICVNPNMAAPYGHIWVDLAGEANYESNGAVALRVTKNTRPISQARQFVSFDKWIKSEGGSKVAIVQDAPNWYARLNKLHWQVRNRELGRASFLQFVGKDTLFYMEALSDDPEADKVQTWQTVGKVAVTDKWDKQIYALQDQVKSLSTRPTRAELDAVAKQVDDLAKSLQEAQEKAKKLESERSQDTIILDESGSWLIRLFNRLFKKG